MRSRLLALAVLLGALVAQAATVTNYIVTSGNVPANTRVAFSPINAPYFDTVIGLVTASDVYATVTRGTLQQSLAGGQYAVTSDAWPGQTFYIAVPQNDSRTYAMSSLLTNSITRLPYIGDGGGLTNLHVDLSSLDISAAIPSAFSIALIPDAQNVIAAVKTNRWLQTIAWLNTNSDIVAVVGLGDVVNTVGSAAEWGLAKQGYQSLTKPHIIGVGNHDWNSAQPRSFTTFNSWFPQSYFTGQNWWNGGFFDSGSETSYLTVTNGSTKILLISLECFPTLAQAQWASNLCWSLPNHIAIIETHSYLQNDGGKTRPSDTYGPNTYGVTDGLAGTQLCPLFNDIANLAIVVCGHEICSPNESHSLSVGASGHWLNQVFCNYQCATDGGGQMSFVKVLTFNPNGSIQARTFDLQSMIWAPGADYSMSVGASGVPQSSKVTYSGGITTTTNHDDTVVVSGASTGTSDLLSAAALVPMTEGSGSTIFDISTNGYSATNSSYWSNGLFVVTNVNQWPLDFGSCPAVSSCTNLSAFVWWKPFSSTYTGSGALMGNFAAGLDGSFYFGWNAAFGPNIMGFKLAWVSPINGRYNDNTLFYSFPNMVDWHLIGITYSLSNLTLYADGAVVGTTNWPPPQTLVTSATRFNIGGIYQVPGFSAPGYYGGAMLLPRTMSAAEVTTAYKTRSFFGMPVAAPGAVMSGANNVSFGTNTFNGPTTNNGPVTITGGMNLTGSTGGFIALANSSGTTNITLDASSGTLTATHLVGDGSGITGVAGSGALTNGSSPTFSNSTFTNGVVATGGSNYFAGATIIASLAPTVIDTSTGAVTYALPLLPMFTIIKTNSLYSLFLTGNGKTNQVDGQMVWITGGKVGTNWWINY